MESVTCKQGKVIPIPNHEGLCNTVKIKLYSFFILITGSTRGKGSDSRLGRFIAESRVTGVQ
jgi:hypothetical protein